MSITRNEAVGAIMGVVKCDLIHERYKAELKDIAAAIKDGLFEPKWIPVGERLPEGNITNIYTNDAYIYPVTVDLNGMQDVRYYSFHQGHWYNNGPGIMDDIVLAWMERPEPYKPLEIGG